MRRRLGVFECITGIQVEAVGFVRFTLWYRDHLGMSKLKLIRVPARWQTYAESGIRRDYDVIELKAAPCA